MNKGNKLKLTFYGGVGGVTGANYLLEDKDIKILVDCGLFQGSSFDDIRNREPFPYNPSDINILFVTHAHLDHIGRIPKLIKDGFSGVIYSTPSTKEISEISLIDSLGILSKEAEKKGAPLLYEKKDVLKSFSLWKTVSYKTPIKINNKLNVVFKDAGHILGSAMVEFSREGEKIVFTGDLGNSPSPLLKDTEKIYDADYLIMESVYGDRNHESIESRIDILKNTIKNTIKKGGALLIPAFSIERTQVLLYEINNLVESGEIPQVPVFLDSPFAIKVTKIYKNKIDNFNKGVREEIDSGDDIFNFPRLKFTENHKDSIEIANTINPKIIIAGSGMSNGGRILSHEKKYLSDQNSALLLSGFQVAGSMGRMIQDGVREVVIDNERIPVRASIINLQGFSSHKDSDNLLDFVSNTADTVKKVFVVMGEPKSALFLVQKIRDCLDVDAVAPNIGESDFL